MSDELEVKAVDVIVKRVIVGVVNDLLRGSIARILGERGENHRLDDDIRKMLSDECQRLFAEDAEVKATLRARLLKELQDGRRF
jgi:hypothetical protein